MSFVLRACFQTFIHSLIAGNMVLLYYTNYILSLDWLAVCVFVQHHSSCNLSPDWLIVFTVLPRHSNCNLSLEWLSVFMFHLSMKGSMGFVFQLYQLFDRGSTVPLITEWWFLSFLCMALLSVPSNMVSRWPLVVSMKYPDRHIKQWGALVFPMIPSIC